MEASNHFHGREIVIWGTREKGMMAKEILTELGFECRCFISSRPKTNTCYGVPLYRPDVLDVEKHYVIVTTRAGEVRHILADKGFDETNERDCVSIWTYWHEDIEYHGCFVGRGTYGYTTLTHTETDLGEHVKRIGRYCSINGTARVSGNHRMDFVTTNPFLYNKRGAPASQRLYAAIDMVEESEARLCEIGNDVWIGTNVFLLAGVKIGDGAIIGAGAIVTHDVEPYAVVGGVPAKVIRYRYPKWMIESFMRIQWWDWPLEKIEENIELFYQPELFCKTFDLVGHT